MASISMNPVFGGHATYAMVSELENSHKLNILKGVLVALAIIGAGVFTLAMPSLEPAADEAQNVAAQARRSAQESLAP